MLRVCLLPYFETPHSPVMDSPSGIRLPPEDDDYVSDGGEVEREVVQQDEDEEGDEMEVEREEVRTVFI